MEILLSNTGVGQLKLELCGRYAWPLMQKLSELRNVKMRALAGCLEREVFLEKRCGVEESLVAKLSIFCKTDRANLL